MKCTDCHRVVLPVVAVDIDGTLAQYHQTFARFAWEYWNIRPRPIDAWDGVGEFEDYIRIDKAMYREAKLAFRQGGMKRSLPMYDDAKEFMQVLWGLPIEVWLTTTRPWMRHDSVDPDTRFWLARNGINFHHLIFDDNKYWKLKSIVGDGRVIAVVDDLPELLVEAREAFGPDAPLLPQRPHNRTMWERWESGKLDSWLVAMVTNRLENWEKKHNG